VYVCVYIYIYICIYILKIVNRVLFVVRKRSLPPAYETDENTYGQEVKEQQQDRTMCDFGLIY